MTFCKCNTPLEHVYPRNDTLMNKELVRIFVKLSITPTLEAPF